jgi:hypothetical protein
VRSLARWSRARVGLAMIGFTVTESAVYQ